MTTTLKKIREAGACGDGFRAIMAHKGKARADDTEVTLEEAIECGVDGAALVFYLLNAEGSDPVLAEALIDHLIAVEPRLAQLEPSEISFYIAKTNCVSDLQIREILAVVYRGI